MTCINCFRTIENLNQIFKTLKSLNTTIPHGYTSGDFDCNESMKDLCYYRLLVLGEYINKIYKTEPDVLLEQRDNDYWRPIIGLRNRLAHCYGEIDPYDIWDIMKYELPDLNRDLKLIVIHAECKFNFQDLSYEEIQSLNFFLDIQKKLANQSNIRKHISCRI